MARVLSRQEIESRSLSLVHQPPAAVPAPVARPLAALSPLERALVDHDLPTVKEMLRNGAEPHLVCPVRLREAAGSDENGVACARLIQVAGRMKRMNLAAPAPQASASFATIASPAAPTHPGPIGRILGRFATRHSNQTASGTDGPIVRALREYDIAAATQALEKAGPPPGKFVFRRHQDRLIGMLALNDTSKLDAWHEKGLLHPSRQPVDEPGVKNFLKQFSHRKLKAGRSKVLFLNGAVKFENTRQKILCRHLAVYWLLHRPLLDNGKIDYASLGSKKNLQKAFKSENQNAHEYYTNNCTNSHLVENDKWGNFLATQFREMQHVDGGAEPKRILICSDNHGMACELRIKKSADGQPTYAVDFYDPNLTASHRQVRTKDLAAVESLSMARLINDKRLTNFYYKNQSRSVAFIISDKTPRPVSTDTRLEGGWRMPTLMGIDGTETIANRQFSSRPGVHASPPPESGPPDEQAQDTGLIDGNYVYRVAREGYSGELPHVFAEISKMPDTSMQVKALSTPSSRGAPPLLVMMALGYESTVAAYTSGVLALETLSGEQKTKILSQRLSTRRHKKMTGIQIALRDNKPNAVSTFARLVLASQALLPDQKCQILNTKINGKNLIHIMPFGMTDSTAESAFVKAVNESGMAPEIRSRLLSGG